MRYNKQAIAVLSLFLLYACGSGNQKSGEEQQSESANSNKKASSLNIKRCSLLANSHYNQITNISGIDIEYVQGAEYSAILEADSILIPYVETEVEGGLLTLSVKSSKIKDVLKFENKHNAKLYLTAPELVAVAIVGAGDFVSKGTWQYDGEISLGTLGTGEFVTDTILCKTFRYQSTDTGAATFSYVKADNALFLSRFGSKIDANIDVSKVEANVDGTSQLTLTGHAIDAIVSKNVNIDNLK